MLSKSLLRFCPEMNPCSLPAAHVSAPSSVGSASYDNERFLCLITVWWAPWFHFGTVKKKKRNYSPPQCSYFVEEPDQYFALAILLSSQMDQNRRVWCLLCANMKTEGLFLKKRRLRWLNYSVPRCKEQASWRYDIISILWTVIRYLSISQSLPQSFRLTKSAPYSDGKC